VKSFEQSVAEVDPSALFATTIEELQLNLGPRCNLSCAHCHLSGSPQRTELVSDRVFGAALELAVAVRPRLIDLTGGAPELHGSLREYLAELARAGLEVQLRTNLTLLLEEGHRDLPELWARQGVRLLASLPSSDPAETARQRGSGTFEKCIAALRALNALGYGTTDGLRLDLVSNPEGSALPGPAAAFEE
jgi:radical SAM/Cys-rich protein